MAHVAYHTACRCAKFETGPTFEPTIPYICFVPSSPKRSATMLDLNNIAADRYHKGPLRKQFSPLVMASEDGDTAITNNHGGTNISTQ